ncbi:hypothetical protein RUM44_012293 [Polyplax serrata]|uniref:Uncharacterized protein n=1 Tax=Polyplax serrata TaxID=468196 RepID=A0ABR1BB84_POLSC
MAKYRNASAFVGSFDKSANKKNNSNGSNNNNNNNKKKLTFCDERNKTGEMSESCPKGTSSHWEQAEWKVCRPAGTQEQSISLE